MILLEWLLLASFALLAIATIARAQQTEQAQHRLETAFYHLLAAENGTISLVQLVVAAQVNAEVAEQFLATQASIFQVLPEVDAAGETFYQFPRIHRSPTQEPDAGAA